MRVATRAEADGAWPQPQPEQLNRLARLESTVQGWLPKAQALSVHEVMQWCKGGSITERLDEPERYQTIYARDPGSAAAPTAGLHFTPELLAALDVERVTLHVGLDTFRPLSAERVEDHRIHGERYEVAAAAWERIRTAERVLAVGTTTVRTLETLARDAPLTGRTELFVTPGFEFRRVDSLLTNFHLPRSTLLALVMAFAGTDETRRLYRAAVEEKYRFYSFGDAMLLL